MHFDRERQRDALTTLQRESGKEATQIAAEIGLSYNQYLRYSWGKTALRIDQFETFARAYGVGVPELARRLGLTDDADTYSIEEFRDHLRSAGLPAEDVEELTGIAAEQPAFGRKSLAEGYVRLWKRQTGGNGHPRTQAPDANQHRRTG